MLEIIAEIFAPQNILLMNIGLMAGIIVGALPGLNPAVGITLLLPFTFGLDSIPGILLLLGCYCGAIYGGSITAILVGVPGTGSAAATMLDGHPLAQQGRAGDAQKAALTGSVFGGLLSCLALMFMAPLIARYALKFGPAEYSSLCVFGLCVVASISGKSVLKGLIMAGLGLLISTIGLDTVDGLSRFMFGRSELIGGVPMICVAMGSFAIAGIGLRSFTNEKSISADAKLQKSTIKLKEIYKHWWVMLRSALTGIFIGAVPGTGGAIAAFLSYNITKNSDKDPDSFGTGRIKGILAPETANNAVSGATLIPMLTLGVPGDNAVAVLGAALIMNGITPGPSLFQDKFWIWCLMGGLFVINLFMFLQGRMFIRGFANITKVPSVILSPIILVLCVIGVFTMRKYAFDVILILAIGLVSYILRRNDYPIPPMVVGLVLGGICERNLRRAMTLSQGSLSIFFTKPISLLFLALAAIFLLLPVIKSMIARLKETYKAPPSDDDTKKQTQE
jgi:putative tricarboxylic transport membrane protein